MRLGTGDVLGVEALVEVERGVDALHDLGRAGGEPAAPGGVGRWIPTGRRGPCHDPRRARRPGNDVMKGQMRAFIVLVVLCALGSLALIEWPFRPEQRQPEQALSDARGDAASPPATLGQFTPLDPPRPAPALSFTERDGTPRQLADFRGHWVLINLWATWCGPCIEEMPSLGRLHAALGDHLTIVAI